MGGGGGAAPGDSLTLNCLFCACIYHAPASMYVIKSMSEIDLLS